jgi:SAM-dependent methyltransferase
VYDALEHETYIDEAPHLKHQALRELYAAMSGDVLRRLGKSPAETRVLDLGAGEGTATMRFLELGARVTAVDSSARQLSYLRARAGSHADRLSIRCGDAFEVLRGERASHQEFDLIITNSFLHHIPDYQQLLEDAGSLLTPTGILFTFQDPLRFSSLGLTARTFTGVAYLAWRISKPDVFGGLGRRFRRMFGVYREDCPEDNAEYHVVRDGVDQNLIEDTLESVGLKVEVIRYFSTQSLLWQRLGTAFRVKNTFAIIAQRQC